MHSGAEINIALRIFFRRSSSSHVRLARSAFYLKFVTPVRPPTWPRLLVDLASPVPPGLVRSGRMRVRSSPARVAFLPGWTRRGGFLNARALCTLPARAHCLPRMTRWHSRISALSIRTFVRA